MKATRTNQTNRITKVQKLIKQCGIRMTALYLKKREYSLDEALVLMFGVHERFTDITQTN